MKFGPTAFATVALVAMAACGSAPVHVDHADRLVQASGDARQLSYRYGTVPSNWDAISIPGNDVAWHDRSSGGVIHIDHSCTAAQDVPLSALVQQLLIGFTEREFATEETVPFDGREARHVLVRASLDGVPTMLELWVLKKDGCVYDIGFVAPPTQFPSGEPAFVTFVHGFATVNTGLPGPRSQGGGP